jgi:hypothetical protein
MHGNAGISRSGALLIAYLMYKLETTYAYVHLSRAILMCTHTSSSVFLFCALASPHTHTLGATRLISARHCG